MAEPEKHVFQTPLGEVWLWGESDATLDTRPVVLALEGAFAIPRPRGFELQGYLPEAAVLNAHLPGNHCPPTSAHSVAAYASAYDEVVRQLGRPAIIVGASIGGLVALAMKAPQIVGLVLLDPPLTTRNLWPLASTFQSWLIARPHETYLRLFLKNVFGITATKVEGVDYRGLLAKLVVPTTVLVGSAPLMPRRAVEEVPSLLDEPERDLLRAHPKVELRVIDGIGHNVGGRAITFVRTAVRELLGRAVAAPAPLPAT